MAPLVGSGSGSVTAPGPAGGVIPDGTYVLTRAMHYSASAASAPAGGKARETFRIRNGTFQWQLESSGHPFVMAGDIRLAGVEMTLGESCPDVTDLVLLYGATASGFWACQTADGATCAENNGQLLRVFTQAP